MSTKTHIRSRSPRGFWRCGVHFTPAGQDYAEGDFKPAQWERLRKEPNLVVSAAADKPAKGKAKHSDGAPSPNAERPATGQKSEPAGAATAPAGEAGSAADKAPVPVADKPATKRTRKGKAAS